MALDPSARKANVKDSIKKFFVDSLKRNENIPITFDRSLVSPKIQGREVDRWVSIMLGNIDLDYMSSIDLRIFCCTKMDNEGFRLAQLRDTVLGYLTDTTASDGMKRITFYKSHPSEAWTVLGAFLVQEIREVGEDTTDDETKFCLLSARLRWESKV
ncbi:MAG: hypothetical protein ABFC98_05905 [Candidatus Cloacimonas sp.]